jgi:hypothetical protein
VNTQQGQNQMSPPSYVATGNFSQTAGRITTLMLLKLKMFLFRNGVSASTDTGKSRAVTWTVA